MTANVARPTVSSLIRPLSPASRPTPTWDRCEVLGNEPIGDRYHRMVFRAPSIADVAHAGQFVMVTVPSAPDGAAVLPRPMAIHRRRRENGTVEIVYGVKGGGTRGLADAMVGESLVLTGPLGVGFRVASSTSHVLLLGRGIGVCSVMGVAEDAAARGVRVTAVLSGRSPEAVIGQADLRELGLGDGLAVVDTDGSSAPGALHDLLSSRPAAEQIMVCGSDRLAHLARGLAAGWGSTVQVSLEARMACGLGYCHGCASAPSTQGKEGPLVCADGPVFALPRLVRTRPARGFPIVGTQD